MFPLPTCVQSYQAYLGSSPRLCEAESSLRGCPGCQEVPPELQGARHHGLPQVCIPAFSSSIKDFHRNMNSYALSTASTSWHPFLPLVTCFFLPSSVSSSCHLLLLRVTISLLLSSSSSWSHLFLSPITLLLPTFSLHFFLCVHLSSRFPLNCTILHSRCPSYSCPSPPHDPTTFHTSFPFLPSSYIFPNLSPHLFFLQYYHPYSNPHFYSSFFQEGGGG
jgi:hypothetical protein